MTTDVRGWIACAAPIALWMVHLTALGALAQVSCDHPGLSWVPHAVTAGLLVACLPFLWMAAQLVRRGAVAGTDAGADLTALGWLGLGMGGASVLLIVAEELIVLGVHPCL